MRCAKQIHNLKEMFFFAEVAFLFSDPEIMTLEISDLKPPVRSYLNVTDMQQQV